MIDFYCDLTTWALPLLVDYSRARISISVFCFQILIWLPYDGKKFPEPTPEQELDELNQYIKEQTDFFAEERQRIYKRMGIETQ